MNMHMVRTLRRYAKWIFLALLMPYVFVVLISINQMCCWFRTRGVQCLILDKLKYMYSCCIFIKTIVPTYDICADVPVSDNNPTWLRQREEWHFQHCILKIFDWYTQWKPQFSNTYILKRPLCINTILLNTVH